MFGTRHQFLTGVLLLTCVGSAIARPPYKQGLKRAYGDILPQAMQNCSTCHRTKLQVANPAEFDETAPPHNIFGLRLAKLADDAGSNGSRTDIVSRLNRIGAEDSDGDGVANDVEILTGSAPGIATDKPTAEQIAGVVNSLYQIARSRAGYQWEPFRPVSRPAPPQVDRSDWNSHPIDRFIAAEHEARGLTARPEASRSVLLRRVTLDLIGLPPSPEELHAFLNDSSPDAYQNVVDRLLDSAQYGERWGRHWMDVWRYSDWAGWTDGKQIRDSQQHIWRWRDWIVESLNDDMPYDRMVTNMLAADELSPADTNSLRATGFLARNYKMLSRETWMQDSVNHTLQAFLGLTVGCARCHDHMYDSISQQEYYSLRSIFEPHQVRLDRTVMEPDTAKDGLCRVYDADLTVATYFLRKGDDRDPDKERPMDPGVLKLLGAVPYEIKPVALPPETYYPGLQPHVRIQLLAAIEEEVTTSTAELEKATTELKALPKALPGPLDVGIADTTRIKASLAQLVAAAAKSRLESLKARIAADDAKYAKPVPDNCESLAVAAGKAEREATYGQAMVDFSRAQLNRTAAIIALKPDDDKLSKALESAEKAVADATQKRDAADEARKQPNSTYSPLTPVYPTESTGRRTALARWITHRNNPLTARVAANQIWLRHFGQALLPTVLDFGQNGQPPTHPALLDWLASELMEPSSPSAQPWSMKHLHRQIVTSKTYRMSSTPEAKNLEIDADNRWLWRMPSRRMEAELVRDGILYVAGKLDLSPGGPDIDYKLGLSINRRSLYFRHAQEKQMEFLKIFDCAAVTECYQRKESIIPQQALALANSELTLAQARVIARRLHESTATNDTAFITAAFERVLSRSPTMDETHETQSFLTRQQQILIAAGERLGKTGDGGLSDVSKPASEPILRSRENLIHVLLNHNDFVTIR